MVERLDESVVLFFLCTTKRLYSVSFFHIGD